MSTDTASAADPLGVSSSPVLIECGKCGAPLDVGEGQTVAKCIYCGGSNRVGSTKTLAAQTPQDWRAPRTWQPATRTVGRTAHIVWWGVGSLLAAGIVTAYVINDTSEPSGTPAEEQPGSTAAELATLELSMTRDAVVERFRHVTTYENTARLALRDTRFEAASLRWNETGDHIVFLHLDPRDAIDRSAIVSALRPHLGPRFRDDSSGTGITLATSYANLHVDADGGVSWRAEPPGEGAQYDWQALARAQWAAVRHAVLGVGPSIDAPTRALLAGHGLDRLAEVDITVPVDDAYRTLSTALPGASSHLSTGLTITVPVDHPWFSGVAFNWANAADGRLESMQVWSLGDSLEADLDSIAACLTPLLGAPEITVSDHLRRERRFTWNMRDSRWFTSGIGMQSNHIWLAMPPADDLRARYRSFLTTLAACGR